MLLKVVIALILKEIVGVTLSWRHVVDYGMDEINSIALSPNGNYYAIGHNVKLKIRSLVQTDNEPYTV